MIGLLLLRSALRRVFDCSAETAVLEDSLQVACSGFSLASYGIPLMPVWLPEIELRESLQHPRRQASE